MGIGGATVRKFTKAEATVVIADIDDTRGSLLKTELPTKDLRPTNLSMKNDMTWGMELR